MTAVSKPRGWFVLLLFGLAVSGALLIIRARTSTARSRAALRLDFAPGVEYRYDLSWQSRQDAKLGTGDADRGAGLKGSVDLRGQLLIRTEQAHVDGWLLGFRFRDLGVANVELQGRSLVDERDLLTRSEALVSMAKDGSIGEVKFVEDAPEVWKQLTLALLRELEFRVVAEGSERGPFRRETIGPFGFSRAQFSLSGERQVARVRETYTTLNVLPGSHAKPGALGVKLDSYASLQLRREGPWQSLRDLETLAVNSPDDAASVYAQVSLSLEYVGESKPARAASPVAAVDRRKPGEVQLSNAAERFTLERKAAGLTRVELLEGLSAGSVPDLNRWLWRATGLLALEPELCVELGRLIETGRFSGHSAELALDLLAGAGTPAAQAALVSALSSSAVEQARNRNLLVQRLSFIVRPTPGTVAYVGEQYLRTRDGAVTYALGATVGSLAQAGDTALARQWNAQLIGDLRGARSPVEEAHLLGALGNAALNENVAEVTRHVTSDSPEVRAAAGRALGHMNTPESVQALSSLLGDASAVVQREALGALAQFPLGRDEAGVVARRLHLAGIRQGNEQRSVSLLAPFVGSCPEAVAALRALAENSTTLPEVRRRIRALLPAT
jgi:hypothetical protein